MLNAVETLKCFLFGQHITTIVTSSVLVAPYKRNQFGLLDVDLFFLQAYLSSPTPFMMVAMYAHPKNTLTPQSLDPTLVTSHSSLLAAAYCPP